MIVNDSGVSEDFERAAEARSGSWALRTLKLSFNAALSFVVIKSMSGVRRTPSLSSGGFSERAGLSRDSCGADERLGGVYRTNSLGANLASSLARIRAKISLSDLALCKSARLLRCLRRVLDLVVIELDEDDEDDEDEDEVEVARDDDEAQARAQCVIACSTIADIAPNLPPNTTELEEDDDEEPLEDIDSGRGVLGGVGGSPRYISPFSLSDSESDLV